MVRILLLATAFLIASCGTDTPDAESKEEEMPVLTAATLGEQQVLTNSEYLAQEPYASANRGTGEQQSQICRACHSLEEGGRNMIGPNLYGFFGQEAGSVEGFVYSPVLQNASFFWTPRAMDAWLAQPHKFLPGNRMSFAGVPVKASRDALIAYLLEATGSE